MYKLVVIIFVIMLNYLSHPINVKQLSQSEAINVQHSNHIETSQLV